MKDAKTDITYCLNPCDKECWRKANEYIFRDPYLYSFTTECIEKGEPNDNRTT